jgi:hypothetical protein
MSKTTLHAIERIEREVIITADDDDGAAPGPCIIAIGKRLYGNGRLLLESRHVARRAFPATAPRKQIA